MPASYFIPLNYASMALSLLLFIAAVVVVSALGKAGFRSYLVGVITFWSSAAVTTIAMTLLELMGITRLGAGFYDFVQIIVMVLLQTAALRFFMHVYLKRHTFAVFYGAGAGFALGNLITNILACITNISIATMMKEGVIAEEYAESYEQLISSIEKMKLVDCVTEMLYPLVMFLVCMALAVMIGHAVRGEDKYLYYAGGAYLAAGMLLTLLSVLSAPAWLVLSLYIILAAGSVYAMVWSKTKYGLSVDFLKNGDYHAPLGRHVDKKR